MQGCSSRDPPMHAPQTDIRMPRRHIKLLEDSYCLSRLQAGVRSAVEAISAGGERDVRVIDLAAGAGVLAATALAAGARHVTAVERWLYLALTAKEILDANGVSRGVGGRPPYKTVHLPVSHGLGSSPRMRRCARGRPSHPTARRLQFHEDRVRVVYKRPTDLQLVKDVPVCANLILAPLLLDEGAGGGSPGRRAGTQRLRRASTGGVLRGSWAQQHQVLWCWAWAWHATGAPRPCLPATAAMS